MIKADSGVVHVEGNSLDCAIDFISIIAGYRETIIQGGLSATAADKLIETCGKIAFSQDVRDAQRTINVGKGEVKERASNEEVNITQMLMELLMDDLLGDNKEVGDEVSE